MEVQSRECGSRRFSRGQREDTDNVTWLVTGTHKAPALLSGLFVWCSLIVHALILEHIILCALGHSHLSRPSSLSPGA